LLPVAGLRVDVVIEDGLLVEVGALGRDLRQVGVDTLQNLLVELLTVSSFEETTDGPGETEAEKLFEEVKVDNLVGGGVLTDAGGEQVDHHGGFDDLGALHRGFEGLLQEVVDGLLRGVIGRLVVERLVLEVLSDKLLYPLFLIRRALRRLERPDGSISEPSIEERLPVEISV